MAGISLKEASQKKNWRVLSNNFSARLIWEGRHSWRCIGWTVSIGLLCFGLALLTLWQTHLLLLQQQALQKNVDDARITAVVKPTSDTQQVDITRQLEMFYAYLPAHDMIPDQIKQLINLAERSGVTLTQAEYKPQAEQNADFLRYQIILPVKAEYPQIQAFIIGALHELPTLVLESVVFKREQIESKEIEARVQYVLLVKKPASKGEHL